MFPFNQIYGICECVIERKTVTLQGTALFRIAQ